ncbi:DUF4136 domain-containing protein [Olivibacter ginsenosidimutans]|uniref:DUF4136 domain-containing protein n=1 Tax=Olivibacter ginsenosidimutans TaxID=1176537 RepID=A0ABP9BPU1_9SPHI
MKSRGLLVALAVIIVTACSPYKYYTLKSNQGDFSAYKTYAWLPGLDSLSKSYYNNAIAEENIYRSADEALKARGLTRDESNPDLLFRYKAIVNNTSRTVYAPMYGGWGWGWGPYWGWGMGGAVGRERFRAGHIIIEAIDAKTKKIVWQGRGSGEVRSPERAVNDLPVVVQNIMKQYPVMAQK